MKPFGKIAIVLCGSITLLVLTLSCGGGGGGNGSVTLTGTVKAPGGTVAFIQPSRLQRFLAGIIGTPAYASIEGLSGVANAIVELVEVDADGADVSVIATAMTDGSGAYSLDAPEGFAADTRYIVRVSGTTDILESRVVGTSVDIDPVTDAASEFVSDATAAEGLSAVTINEIEEILNAVDDVANGIDPSGMGSDELTDALTTAVSNNEEATNIISSTTASGEICGTVRNSSSGLADIRIAAYDFENHVTRAKTKTAADGTYCLNLPVQGDTDAYTGSTLNGEYVLAAFNRTGDTNDPGRHASEFWSAGGIAYNAFNADKLTLTPGAPTFTGRNFMLEPGARITGTVTGFDTAGAGLEGIKVFVRDFDTRIMLVSAPVGSDGAYRMNVIPGRYLVGVRNRTIKPYASEVYDGGTGTHNRNLAAPVTVAPSQVRTLDFELAAGSQLSGTVTDGASALPVTGMGVYIDNATNGGSTERLRTDKLGFYRIWLRPELYDVFVYGQRSLDLNLAASQVVDFGATVSSISGTVEDSGSDPVREVKMRVYDAATRDLIGRVVTNSDGTYTVYSDQTGDHRLEARIDGESSIGGQMYIAHTRHDSGEIINIATLGDSATADMTLGAGGVLRMIAYEGNGSGIPDRSTPVANERFQIRDDDLPALGTGTAGADVFFSIRTRGDGTVMVTIPAGIYDRLRLTEVDSGAGSNACGSFTITAGQTTTVEFFDGDNTCIQS